jgi:hypothetical protein
LPLARNWALFLTQDIIKSPSPASAQRFLASNNFGPVPFLWGWWHVAHFALNNPSPWANKLAGNRKRRREKTNINLIDSGLTF